MRRENVVAAAGCAMIGLLTVNACADRSLTAPDRAESPAAQNLLGGLVGAVTNLLIAPVQRTTPLPADVTWSFTAGSGGAVSSNSAVGLTVFVPPGALSSTKTITVTALAGAPVAYRFEPHLEFSRKVVLTQNLNGTKVGLIGLLVLSGAHFSGDAPAYSGGLAVVDEIVPALVSLLTRKASFGVDHFTGWILASGRGEEAY